MVSDPISRAPAEVALTVRDLVLQVSGKIDGLAKDLQDFKPTVVTKAELNLFREVQRAQRNWSIGIIITMLGVSAAWVSLVFG